MVVLTETAKNQQFPQFCAESPENKTYLKNKNAHWWEKGESGGQDRTHHWYEVMQPRCQPLPSTADWLKAAFRAALSYFTNQWQWVGHRKGNPPHQSVSRVGTAVISLGKWWLVLYSAHEIAHLLP